MALPHNRQGVKEILKILEPRIIGQERPGWSCGCGCVKGSDAVATAIEPAGDEYPGQETGWACWSVEMTAKEPGGHSWSCDLSKFIPCEELRELFGKYFPDKGAGENPYELSVRGTDRADAGLPLAVSIMDNGDQTRFIIDWGKEQSLAKEVCALLYVCGQPRRGESDYQHVVDMLKRFSPLVYRGGPDPELPYESRWLMDFVPAVNALEDAPYVGMFWRNGHQSWCDGVETYGGISIVFSKK